MQNFENVSSTSLKISPNKFDTITFKSSINDTTNNDDDDPKNFNIEKIISSIYEIKSDSDYYKLKESVVLTNNPEYIYLFAQGILDIFFEEQHFNNVSNNGITISQKNIIYDETLNLLLEQSNKNHALSQFLLGKIYYTRRIYYKSFRFFELSFKNHFHDSAFYLGLFFEHGLGVDRDIRRAEFLYHCAIESTLGHITMLQLAHLYLNQKVNGKIRIQEALFWLERAATLDSDLIDMEKINYLKSYNSNTINPLPLYESSNNFNKDDVETIIEVVAPPRVQSLPFMTGRAPSKNSFSNNTTPLLTPHTNKERRRSLASAKINKQYAHNHSYSYSYGTSNNSNTTQHHQHNNSHSSSSKDSQYINENIQEINEDIQENVTEAQNKKETEDDNIVTENDTINSTEQEIEYKGNISQDSIESNSSLIMSPSTIEGLSKYVINDDDNDSVQLEFAGKNYYEKMKQKVAMCKDIQFNLQVQAEACFILYELYKNGYSNLKGICEKKRGNGRSSAGTIVGVIIGVLAFVGIVTFIVFYFIIIPNRNKKYTSVGDAISDQNL